MDRVVVAPKVEQVVRRPGHGLQVGGAADLRRLHEVAFGVAEGDALDGRQVPAIGQRRKQRRRDHLALSADDDIDEPVGDDVLGGGAGVRAAGYHGEPAGQLGLVHQTRELRVLGGPQRQPQRLGVESADLVVQGGYRVVLERQLKETHVVAFLAQRRRDVAQTRGVEARVLLRVLHQEHFHRRHSVLNGSPCGSLVARPPQATSRNPLYEPGAGSAPGSAPDGAAGRNAPPERVTSRPPPGA